jgi:hypothetical protein
VRTQIAKACRTHQWSFAELVLVSSMDHYKSNAFPKEIEDIFKYSKIIIINPISNLSSVQNNYIAEWLRRALKTVVTPMFKAKYVISEWRSKVTSIGAHRPLILFCTTHLGPKMQLIYYIKYT